MFYSFFVAIVSKALGTVVAKNLLIVGVTILLSGPASTEGQIAETTPVPLVRVGLQDIFPVSTEAETLLDHFGMGVKDTAEAVKKAIVKRDELGRI